MQERLYDFLGDLYLLSWKRAVAPDELFDRVNEEMPQEDN